MFGQEKRRRSCCRDCILTCPFEGNELSCPRLVNWSSGGPGVAGTEGLPTENGQLLLTILRLAKEMELPSRVVWVNPEAPGCGKVSFGVEFEATPEETEKKLGRFFPSCMEL